MTETLGNRLRTQWVSESQTLHFSVLPRTSSPASIPSLLLPTIRRAVNGDTWMAILAAHTAKNELRTFSIVFLKGKSSKNHERLHCLAGGMEFCTRGFRADPNEICPSYFLPLHAHSRVIFKSAGLIFCPPSPREQFWMIAIAYGTAERQGVPQLQTKFDQNQHSKTLVFK